MEKVVYLFGAGASEPALPLVKDIPQRLFNMIDKLNSADKLDDTFFDSGPREKTKFQYQQEMIETLKWLHSACKHHASIDTLAKKLFLKKNYTDLRKLKVALSIFFVCEQAIQTPNIRYDSFFAAILNSATRLPEHIRILSWNYDFQFEKSYSEYIGEKHLSNLQTALNVYSKNFINDLSPGFCIFKLNGTSAFLNPDKDTMHQIADSIEIAFDKNFMAAITWAYVYGTNAVNSGSAISFSWEPDNNHTISSAISSIKDASILVVIGYSFPFFNREIDRKLILSMTELKKIYFQDPLVDEIVERFQAIQEDIKGLTIVKFKDKGQFILPNEL